MQAAAPSVQRPPVVLRIWVLEADLRVLACIKPAAKDAPLAIRFQYARSGERVGRPSSIHAGPCNVEFPWVPITPALLASQGSEGGAP
jgi:hypothetical protein